MASEGSSFGAGGGGGAVNESPGGGKLVNCKKKTVEETRLFLRDDVFIWQTPPAGGLGVGGRGGDADNLSFKRPPSR